MFKYSRQGNPEQNTSSSMLHAGIHGAGGHWSAVSCPKADSFSFPFPASPAFSGGGNRSLREDVVRKSPVQTLEGDGRRTKLGMLHGNRHKRLPFSRVLSHFRRLRELCCGHTYVHTGLLWPQGFPLILVGNRSCHFLSALVCRQGNCGRDVCVGKFVWWFGSGRMCSFRSLTWSNVGTWEACMTRTS